MVSEIIVEPAFGGVVLSSHLLKSQLRFLFITVIIFTSIKRSLLLGGRGHPLQS